MLAPLRSRFRAQYTAHRLEGRISVDAALTDIVAGRSMRECGPVSELSAT